MLDLKHLVFVMLGGGLGSGARYAIGIALGRVGSDFPWATFGVNVVGCLAFGGAFGFVQARGGAGSAWAVFLLAGVLGGFTTFSSFGFETITLLARDRIGTATLYALASLVVGLAAVWAGLRIGGAGPL